MSQMNYVNIYVINYQLINTIHTKIYCSQKSWHSFFFFAPESNNKHQNVLEFMVQSA